MSAEETIVRLRPARAAGGFEIAADRALCLGPPEGKHMSGGSCVAAMLLALIEDTKRLPVSVSAHFFAPRSGATANIRTEALKAGRTITLARADMRVGEALSVTLSASLAPLFPGAVEQAIPIPNTKPPHVCQRIPFVREDAGDLHTHLDMRLIIAGEGFMASWVKAPEADDAGAFAFLAMIADYLPEALHLSLGRRVGAVSFDNQIRFVSPRLTEWVRCATTLDAVADGRFHGHMHIFDEAGRLLAVASQSGRVRELGI